MTNGFVSAKNFNRYVLSRLALKVSFLAVGLLFVIHSMCCDGLTPYYLLKRMTDYILLNCESGPTPSNILFKGGSIISCT